jgi:hypothetical protein
LRDGFPLSWKWPACRDRSCSKSGGQRDECYNWAATWELLWLRNIAFWRCRTSGALFMPFLHGCGLFTDGSDVRHLRSLQFRNTRARRS